MFKILKRKEKTGARLGILRTLHGIVKTPAFVVVATHAQVRCLKPSDIKKTKTQIVIANAYHLRQEVTNKRERSVVLQKLGIRIPTMTDSGGFQVFSLGISKEHGVGKVLKRTTSKKGQSTMAHKVRITERGAYFTVSGRRKFLSPENSIAIQKRLGADIIFAFDECTSPLHSYSYTKRSLERTNRWAARCLKVHTKKNQLLFGIVQGGRFRQLRMSSAKTIGSMPFDGFGIGGSFGKDEMRATLASVIPYLPKEKPRHLLGIGTIADIFDAVEAGVDLFDCVIPTREARHGRIWTSAGPYDVRRGVYAKKQVRLKSRCRCPACTNGITKARLHLLFKTKRPQAGRFATLHNVWFFNTLMERMRMAIAHGKLQPFKRATLNKLRTLQI